MPVAWLGNGTAGCPPDWTPFCHARKEIFYCQAPPIERVLVADNGNPVEDGFQHNGSTGAAEYPA